MKKTLIFTGAIMTLALTSCKDKVAPTITLAEPANHSHHAGGDTIHVMATFSDDKELANYHVHIGDVDGEHVHDWHYEMEGPLSSESYDFHDMMIVPDTSVLTSTVYYLHFEVSDAEGNTTMDKLMLHFD